MPEIDELELRTALGIDEDDDPVAIITAMRTEMVGLKAAIAADPKKTAAAGELDLRTQLVEAERKFLTLQSETDKQIAMLRQERNDEKAVNLVERAIANGDARPVQREILTNMAKRDLKGTEEFIKTLPKLDMQERGVASGNELADLEPTPTEISIAKSMGTWDDTNPAKSRHAIMRVKAQQKGLTLPAEIS